MGCGNDKSRRGWMVSRRAWTWRWEKSRTRYRRETDVVVCMVCLSCSRYASTTRSRDLHYNASRHGIVTVLPEFAVARIQQHAMSFSWAFRTGLAAHDHHRVKYRESRPVSMMQI